LPKESEKEFAAIETCTGPSAQELVTTVNARPARVSIRLKTHPVALVLKSERVTPVTDSLNVKPKLGDSKLVAAVVANTGSAAVRLMVTAVLEIAAVGPAFVAASASELAASVTTTEAASAHPETETE
jgi:hypothetical protein